MRLRSLLVAATLVPTALLTTAAGPGSSCEIAGNGADSKAGTADDVLVCTLDTYASCANSVGTKVQLFSPFGHADASVSDAPLVTNAPEASFQGGAGCGHLTPPLLDQAGRDHAATVGYGEEDDVFETTWVGEYTGNLRSISVETHYLLLNAAHIGEEFATMIRVEVDGKIVFADVVTAEGEVSSTQASAKVVYPIDLSGAGFATEAGKGATTRDIRVMIGHPASGDSPIASSGLYVWGASEIPGGVTFNGAR